MKSATAKKRPPPLGPAMRLLAVVLHSPGLSADEAARRMGVGRKTARNYAVALRAAGLLERAAPRRGTEALVPTEAGKKARAT